jgi:elongation factor 1 alpha-like protein
VSVCLFFFLGHVDAGKSTLMGRLLYECGQVEEKRRRDHERASEKAGKASFSWAWELDAGTEERERLAALYITANNMSSFTLEGLLWILLSPFFRRNTA